MTRIGTGLLKQSKGDNSSHHKNILSILVHANTIEEKAHQMNDEDVMSRAYKLILDRVLVLIYFQRSLLSSLLVMQQQGTHIRLSDNMQ